ncbi:MAG: hypothetical protein P8182_08135, partial [Deltaproteobacteria bacterium]
FRTALAAVSVLCIWGAVLIPNSLAQEFPYLAPEAPEFDQQGAYVGSGPVEKPETRAPAPAEVTPRAKPRRNKRAGTIQPVPPRGSAAGPIGRSAPKAPTFGSRARSAPHRNTYRRSPTPRYAPRRRAPTRQPPRQYAGPRHSPPMASRPGAAPGAVQQAPDCTQYPMMIAQARSEGEMRMAARQYLTCLLRNGWSLAQAKKHVISVIETSYRYIR